MNLTTAYSLWLAPLCVLLGVLYAWVLYRRAQHQHGWARWLVLTLSTLRAMVVAVLAFFLLEPMVRIWLREVRKPVVVIAHDGSSSLVIGGDTAAIRIAYAEALEQLSRKLGDKFQVSTFTYGQQVRDGLHFDQGDKRTDMDQLLREVYDRFSGPDLGAVILDGDGIYNRGRDPRYAANRLAVPVYTIAMGDTTVHPDLVLKAAEHNRITFLGNEFPILARIEARHLRGARTRVVVAQEGKELVSKDLTVTGDPLFVEVPLLVKATRPGLQRFSVVLNAVEGEVTTENNRLEVYVDVVDDRQKILLLAESPHPDLAAIRMALSSLEGYEVQLAMATDPGADADDYDLVILHQLPSQRARIDGLLKRCADRNIPICVVLGAASDLGRVTALGAGVEVIGMQRTFTDAQASFNKDFNLFELDPVLVRAFERFPPLQVPFGDYEAGPGAMVLFEQKVGVVRTAHPLIAFQQVGDRHVATICGEGLWRWRMADHQHNGSTARFDGLMHKLVQFLALRVSKDRFRVHHPAEFAEGERVIMTADLYNPAFELVNDPEATVVIRDEAGRDYPFSFSRGSIAYRLDAGSLPPGQYTWSARVEFGGEKFTDKGEFLVNELVAERLNTVADHGLLADLAAVSGAAMVRSGELDRIADILMERKDLVAQSHAQASFSDLIGLRWIFFLLFALLSIEWALRRRSGAY